MSGFTFYSWAKTFAKGESNKSRKNNFLVFMTNNFNRDASGTKIP
jgi:hypothetical protein